MAAICVSTWAPPALRPPPVRRPPCQARGGPAPELIELLTYGRGVDNRRLKRAGFDYLTTSAGAVPRVRRGGSPARALGRAERVPYQYERDVEDFFRHSPAVVRD